MQNGSEIISCPFSAENVSGHEYDVLVAIDQSENALKVAEYVGKMMRSHPTVRITLLNIIRPPSPDIMPDEEERQIYTEKKRSDANTLINKAREILMSFSIPENQIFTKIQVCEERVSIADQILREKRACGYGTIVVGKRGMSKKEEFLFGSVSRKIVRECEKNAVWVVA
jgi:nucleotide-binding universal stress UspA family protein